MSLSRGSSTLLHPSRACRRVDFFFSFLLSGLVSAFLSLGILHSSHPSALFALHIHHSLGHSGLHSINSNSLGLLSLLSLQLLIFLPKFIPACRRLTSPLLLSLLDLFGGGSTSQCQLARPTDLTTTRALTNGRKDEDERCVFIIISYMHTQQLDDTYHDFSDIPFYDEYSYRYSHHRIFRASHTKMSWISTMISPAFLRSSQRSPFKHCRRRIKQSLFRSVEPTSVPYPFSNNNSVYVLLLPIVSLCLYHTPLSS